MNICTVSEITRYIKQLLDKDGNLSAVFIRGEISNFKQHYSGHCYFTLKDSAATIRAVMFRSRAQYLKFVPRSGLKVIAVGYISVFERDGQYQLYVDQLLPDGIGELSLAFAQLKDKLAAEGLFDEARKRQLPLLPQTVGVITSPTGAAIRDIVTVAKRRHSGIRLVLYPVQVQGTEAPAQIIKAIQVFNRAAGVDVIIAGRGGGSLEELWAFNDEGVVRAIAQSAIPIISAVGHQTDFTLADFAADCRAATPSQAAELVVPDVNELKRYLTKVQTALSTTMRNRLKEQQRRLERVMMSRAFARPKELLMIKQQAVDSNSQQLMRLLSETLQQKRHDLAMAAEKLTLLSPLAVLERGYSIVRTLDGRVISRAQDITVGQELEVKMHQGNIDVQVIDAREDDNDGQVQTKRTAGS